MIFNTRSLVVTALAVVALALAACGGASESDDERMAFATSDDAVGFDMSDGESRASGATAIAPGLPMAPAPSDEPAAFTRPSAGAAFDSKGDFEAREEAFRDEADAGQTAQLVSQDRIIVRTVDMSLEVADVAAALDEVAALAVELGGWVVDTNRSERHRGRITVRVPADRLDEAVLQLRDSAIEVKSELSTSQDVTDQYYDATARLSSLEVERDALRTLFDDATDVEDALRVRETLGRVQGDIEVLQAQIDRLQRTSAFSLVTVNLEAKPSEMTVDGGQDQTAGVGESVRFRATFMPPEDMEDFLFTWDFGDGSRLVTSDRTAPTEDPDTRVTATVTHQYGDERDSPYFAEVKITGTGDAGLAEGEDTLVVTVTRVPTIEVFAGDGVTVEEGQEVEFSGSFTRPEGVSSVEFTWDFGDGSPPATGALADGVTVAVAVHTYENFRPFAYRATLTVTGTSEAGDSKGVSSVNVRVTEAEGWVVAGWSLGDQGKSAARSLSQVVQWAISALVWAAILSPAWGAILVAGFLGWRFRPWRRRGDAGSGE